MLIIVLSKIRKTHKTSNHMFSHTQNLIRFKSMCMCITYLCVEEREDNWNHDVKTRGKYLGEDGDYQMGFKGWKDGSDSGMKKKDAQ